ncbi:MAG: ABC transporter substrate-binding protein [Pseudomonadota bacterium]
MLKTIISAALVAAALGAASAVPASADTLNVGAYPANPPWEVKQEDGSFVGFEVDLVNAVAEKLSMEPEFQDLGFQALFAATSSGRIDMAISSITVTNDRLESQDFSQPYYDADLALGVREDSGVKTLADLAGKSVGVLSASTGEKWAREHGEKHDIDDVRGYDAYQQMLLDVQAGRIAAAISDLPGMLFAFTKMKGMAAGETIPTGDQYAIMLAKGSPLTEKVSEAITALKEDGTLAKIHEKHFGTVPGPLTSTVKVLPTPKAE